MTVPDYIYDGSTDSFTFHQLFVTNPVTSSYFQLIRVPQDANMRMTETCTVTSGFCITFPMHFLILTQIPSTLAINNALNDDFRDITVTNINSAYYRYAPNAYFYMEIWSNTFDIE
jgi:hypothetical protein